MSSIDRIHRLLRLVELLQSGRVYNSNQLAELSGVSRRTIFRDLNTLQESAVQVHYDEERQGYLIPAPVFLPTAEFTLDETLSLLVLCHGLGDKSLGIPFQRPARSAALKLLSNLPHHLREAVADLTDAIDVRADAHNPLDGAHDNYRLFTKALRQRRQVRIRYKSLTEWDDICTVVSPYRILFSRRSWYLIGRSSLHRSVRTFNVGRILKSELLPSGYEVPPRFSLDRYLRNAWHLIKEPGRSQSVVIRFKKLVAQNVAEVRWHKTQKVDWNADGSIDFHAEVDGLNEILWWILGYGDQAEVLKPAKLRDMVKQRVGCMSQIYQDTEPQPAQRRKRRQAAKSKTGKKKRKSATKTRRAKKTGAIRRSGGQSSVAGKRSRSTGTRRRKQSPKRAK